MTNTLNESVRKVLLAGAAVAAVSNANAANLPRISAPFVAEATIDLGDAQATLLTTLNGSRRDDRCGSNWNVWDAKVIPNGRAIKVDLNARFFENKCVIAGVPEVRGWRVRMRDRVIAETVLFSQAGHIVVDITPVIQNGTITVNTHVVTADMSGLLGRLKLNGQVKDILNDKIRDALRDKLPIVLPAEMLKAAVEFNEVSFIDLGGGKLGLRVKALGKLRTNS